MDTQSLHPEQVDEITSYVDIQAPPPVGVAGALFVFGSSQVQPAEIATEWYRQGLARLIIVTGGVNRHSGFVAAPEFRRLLIERGVPDAVIRCEAMAANTWQNVEFSLPYLREAKAAGLPVTVVGKWFHRSAVHCLATLAPEIGPFHAVTWEPVYGGRAVTRADWPLIPEGERRVVREWEEVSRRVTGGSLRPVRLVGGAWRG